MKKVAFSFLATLLIVAFIFPQSAHALSALQVESILGLLRAFDADDSVVQNVSNTLQGNTGVTTSSIEYRDTLQLSRDLSRGMKGADIERLQRYLRTTGDYKDDITGYYGVRTEEAVQSWQAKNGIVRSGTPSTTGYGNVGPSTRTALTNAARTAVSITPQIPDETGGVETSSVTPTIPNETRGVETNTLPTPTIPDETRGQEFAEFDDPLIPDEGPGVDRVDSPYVSVYAEGDMYSVKEGHPIKLLWRSGNTTSCTASFVGGGAIDSISGSLSGVNGEIVVVRSNIRSFDFNVRCIGQNKALSVTETITITLTPVLPTGAQKAAILDLLRSFGASDSHVSLVEKVLDGEVVTKKDARLVASKLSQNQINAILSLSESFGLSKSVITSLGNVLYGTQSDTDIAIRQIIDLLKSFGGSASLATLTEQALRGEVFRIGDSRLVPSNLSDTQIRALVDLARQTSFSSSVISSLSIVLNGKAETVEFNSKYIAGSEYFKVHDPEIVQDARLGNLMYFVGGVTVTTPEGIYMAPGCPNGTQYCSNAVKVIDTKALGIEKVASPTVVTLTDAGSRNDYHIMYFSGTKSGTGRTQPEIYYTTSWVGDGVNWSAPQVLLSGYQFPEAVRDFKADFSSPGQGEVLLFANYVNEPEIALFRMSMTGVDATGPQKIILPGYGVANYNSVDVAIGCDGRCYYSLYAGANYYGKKGIQHFYGIGASPAEAVTRWYSAGNLAPVNDEKSIGSPTHYRHVYGYTNQNLFYSDSYGYIRTRVASNNTFAQSFLGKFATALERGARSIANVFTSLFGR